MSKGEAIAIMIIIAALVITLGSLLTMFDVLSKRYERFYLTTDLGKELHKLLYNRDKLDTDIDWCKRRLKSTRDKLDEIHRYYPKNEYFRKESDILRLEYLECKRDLSSKQALVVDCEVQLEKIKKQLPKSCKNILQYDWRNVNIKYEDDDYVS